jgi:hypothetical protein
MPDADYNLDKVLAQVTGAKCREAADELGRYLDAGLTATRELLAAFLNDLNDECLARWGPRPASSQDDQGLSERDADARSRQRSVACRRREGCRWRQVMWT